MQPITPVIKLHIIQEEQGAFLNALVLEHQENNYHFHGGTGDAVHVFTESLAIYVLSINKDRGYISLNAYMAPEPDPINSVSYHSAKEIRDALGGSWEQMTPKAMVTRLIEYLC